MSDVSKTDEELEKLALAAEDAAGGPPSAEQVDALVAYADALRDALEAAPRVPVQGEPNDEPTDALALVEEVIATHADRIGTHYEDCYKHHVACLAVEVKHRLGGER